MSKQNGVIRIEKNVPLPSNDGRGRHAKYPWEMLKIGESFFAPVPIRSISHNRAMAQYKLNRKFTARSEEGGTRVWRIA